MSDQAIQRDLERLDQAITFNLRRAGETTKTDTDLAKAYREDATALQRVRTAAARGDLAGAGRVAYDLDTIVRDQIPRRLFNALMKANGTNH